MARHKHLYERTIGAFQGKPDVNGTVQIINGAAGNNEGVEKGNGIGGLVVAKNYASQGFGELALVNASYLRWRYFISSHPTDAVDEVFLPAK